MEMEAPFDGLLVGRCHSRPQSPSFLGHVVFTNLAKWLWGREWAVARRVCLEIMARKRRYLCLWVAVFLLYIWIFLLALLDLFAAFSVWSLRFSSLAGLKRENLAAIERRSQQFWCNDWLERQVLDLINTLISMDDNRTHYILLPNAIICKPEVLQDPVPSFVSRSLPYCRVVGLKLQCVLFSSCILSY